MRGLAEWKPKLRCEMRRMRLLSPSRRPLVRPRRIAARMPWRCWRIVRASMTNGSSLEREGQGEPGVEVRWRECGVLELVKQPQLLLEEEGAEHRLLGVLDFSLRDWRIAPMGPPQPDRDGEHVWGHWQGEPQPLRRAPQPPRS